MNSDCNFWVLAAVFIGRWISIATMLYLYKKVAKSRLENQLTSKVCEVCSVTSCCLIYYNHVSVDELHAISYDTHTQKLMLPIQDCTSKYGYNDLETLHIPSLQICLMSVEKCRFEPLRTLTELLSHCSPLVKTIH